MDNLLIGNDLFVESIKSAKKSGNLGTTTLITAPDGCGRWLAARILAALYLCDNEKEIAYVTQHLNTEITVLHGEGITGEIKTESVRNMRKGAYETALVGKGRIVIVRDAHRLNKSSANALLKILEEPPPEIMFILTAKSADELLPTIRSRCKLYRITPVSESETSEYLKKTKLGDEDKKLLHTAFCGKLGLIKNCVESKKNIEMLKRAERVVSAASAGERYPLLLELTGKGKDDRSEFSKLFLCLTHLFEAKAREKISLGDTDVTPFFRAAAAVGEAENALARNINQKLMITWLCDRIFEEFNGKRNHGGI